MAQINIITTEEEQQCVLEAIKKLSGKTVAVSAVAKEAGMNHNRVCYIVSTSTTLDTDMKCSFKQ